MRHCLSWIQIENMEVIKLDEKLENYGTKSMNSK